MYQQENIGHFHSRYTLLQLLTTLQELCQMLDDTFAIYPQAILAVHTTEGVTQKVPG